MDQKTFMEQTRGKAIICADVGVRGKKTEDILTDGEYSLSLCVTKQKPGFFQKIIGYIPCTDKQGSLYVRVLGPSVVRIIVLVILLAILVTGGMFLWLSRQEEGPDLDKAAIAYEMPEGLVNTNPDSITLPGYSLLTMSNTDGIVHIPLLNPEGNTCYFVYTISLVDSNEVLYESGYIEPGNAVPGFRLNQTLEPGIYDIKVDVAAWDIKDYTVPLNGGSIEAELEVEE